MKEGMSIEGDFIQIWEDSIVIIEIKKPAHITLRQVQSYVDWFLIEGQGLIKKKGKENK